MLPDTTVPAPAAPVFVAAFGREGSPAGVRMLDQLRAAGIPAVTDYDATTLKALLRQADRYGSPITIILGDDEAAKGRTVLRDMKTKEQSEVPLTDVLSTLQKRLGTA
jgi:histidyl-tRNA synthetase